MHNSFIGPNSLIGENCIINTGAIIEHDVKIVIIVTSQLAAKLMVMLIFQMIVLLDQAPL